MALNIKDVVKLIIYYVGTSKLGALPLKPTIGVNIGGTPAMSVDLFATLGGIFPNLSAAIQGALTSTFKGLITSLGLDPASPFMSSPIGTAYKELDGVVKSTIADLQLSANIGIDAATKELDTAVSAWKSWVDTAVGIPPTMITGISPENLVISEAAQAVAPNALLSNLDLAVTHAIAIEQGVIQPAFSTVLFDAAKADINLIASNIASATTQTARDLLGNELKNTLVRYTSDFNAQTASVTAAVNDITKTANANAAMAAAIAPASANLFATQTLAEKAKQLTNASPATLAALTKIGQAYTNVVDPVFIKEVVPAIQAQATRVSNTTVTAVNRLAEATANVAVDETGYPIGVNLHIG